MEYATRAYLGHGAESRRIWLAPSVGSMVYFSGNERPRVHRGLYPMIFEAMCNISCSCNGSLQFDGRDHRNAASNDLVTAVSIACAAWMEFESCGKLHRQIAMIVDVAPSHPVACVSCSALPCQRTPVGACDTGSV